MHLNVGCGNHRVDGWVNLDVWAGPGVYPDMLGTATALPFRDWSVDAVYCGHVLEHLGPGVELDRALCEIRRVLHPDGRLCVVGPDCDRVLANWAEWGPLWDGVRYGGDRWPGDRHQWRSTGPDMLAALRPFFPTVVEVDVGVLDDFWPLVDDPGWQFAIVTEAP